ncbi:MAG TPA: Fe-S cluster assembly protein SufB [Opitutaceae bacterium]|nr:Fe-S cluster assembly protein SufB [Opitutaceae bacterium]
MPLERDAGAGVSERIVGYLSASKGEPAWLWRQRVEAVRALAAPCVLWAPAALAELRLEQLHCYTAPRRVGSLEEVPPAGTTAALLRSLEVSSETAQSLGGAQAQVDGEVVYRTLEAQWAEAGVVFVDSTRGLTDYGELFRPYFGTVVSRDENAFTQLNAAVFSGGAFIHVPAGVKVAMPLKCFMHLQAPRGGQFGRTLIVLGAGAELTFMEGCTSAARTDPMLHCSVGEFVLGPEARLNYIALQDWTPNVFNLAILRARLAAGAVVHWIDCNLGGRLTMKYPCALLEGEGAAAEAVSIAVARGGQHHDSGAKMLHRARDTTSKITSKSVSIGTGRSDYRGLVDMPAAICGCVNHTECDALLIDPTSRTDTYPAIHVIGGGNTAQHEATVSRLSAEQIFYIQQRGLSESAARSLSVNGFVNNLVERFPLQYSVKIKRLIELHMAGSVG